VVQTATTVIPIVSVGQEDLREKGLADNFARPNGNVTGLSSPPLVGKSLQLLRETLPGFARVVALMDGTFGTSADPYEQAAAALGLPLQVIWVTGLDDLERTFSSTVWEGTEAVIVGGGPFLQQSGEAPIADLALRYRLPSMWTRSEPVRLGGLMGYGANRSDLRRRAAVYVDKILKGAKPADLPIEQPTLFDFSINLKTARALGITIPPSMLGQATEVIQ
jgi:putative ABC transport system substrate-binding protein